MQKASYYQTFASISELNPDYKPEMVMFPNANFGKCSQIVMLAWKSQHIDILLKLLIIIVIFILLSIIIPGKFVILCSLTGC